MNGKLMFLYIFALKFLKGGLAFLRMFYGSRGAKGPGRGTGVGYESENVRAPGERRATGRTASVRAASNRAASAAKAGVGPFHCK